MIPEEVYFEIAVDVPFRNVSGLFFLGVLQGFVQEIASQFTPESSVEFL